MAGWSIRRKLGLLVTIPMIALLVGGGFLVTSIGLDYRSAHTARVYADAVSPALDAMASIDAEFAATGVKADQLSTVRARTDQRVAAFRTELQDLRTNGNEQIVASSATALDALDSLDGIRRFVDRQTSNNTAGTATGQAQLSANVTTLSSSLRDFLQTLTSGIGAITPDEQTAQNVMVLAALSQTVSGARIEQALYTSALRNNSGLSTDNFAAISQAIAEQTQGIRAANASATAGQKAELTTIAGDNTRLEKFRDEQTALQRRTVAAAGTPGTAPLQADPAARVTWEQFSGGRITAIDNLLDQTTAGARADAKSSENRALLRAGIVALAVILTLVVVTALLAAIARSVTSPLRRLRAGAVDIASVQLPAAVARIEQDGVAADVSLPPVLPADAAAGPETFEVARAVDDLGAEAVRLATAQVRLRRALDEAFVSMSRRSQSMVEKQLAIIDELESQEQDPDQLRNLFRLDHLAARMRRYNDNLLVLAGSAVRTRATAPVKVAELFRAATSEMEQYERVRLQPVSGASVAGTVAGELVHLLAELLDNAAMYSPPSSPIVLSAAFTADGGLQIEVLDAGVGISPGELDRLNARLTQPEAIDTQVPSRMGLFVVARLARRGGFGVMLQTRADAAGTVALVRVPATLVIGAPGSTGEQPSMGNVQLRPGTPAAGYAMNRQSTSADADYTLPPAPPLPSRPTAPSPAAAAAGAAAAAAAGIRSMPDSGSAGGALPKRRRGGAGMPAEASAPPATGLFTPATPSGPLDLPADGDQAPAARRGSTPPETTPNGIPAMPQGDPGIAPPSDTPGLPVRPGGAPRLPQRSPGAGPGAFPGQGPMGQGPLGHGPLGHGQTPDAGINGLPGLDPARASFDQGRPADEFESAELFQPSPSPEPYSPPSSSQSSPQDPLTARTGEFRAPPNVEVPPASLAGGGAPSAWDDALPTELAARAAAAAAYSPADPDAPMIGEDIRPDADDPTPIFDQISVWFTAEPTGSLPVVAAADEDVIDLREAERQGERQPSSRWASLGDQRWLATNARAAAAPDTEGTTQTGLPLRRPGANLLPSASSAAPAAPLGRPVPAAAPSARAPEHETGGTDSGPHGTEPSVDPDLVRGRLGSYQRGLANARRARNQQVPEPAFDPVGASLFTTKSDGGPDESGRNEDQGADK